MTWSWGYLAQQMVMLCLWVWLIRVTCGEVRPVIAALLAEMDADFLEERVPSTRSSTNKNGRADNGAPVRESHDFWGESCGNVALR